MRYVQAVLRWERRGQPRHSRKCCARMVWPSERFVHQPEVCDQLLNPTEVELEKAADVEYATRRRTRGRRGKRGRHKG